MHSPKVWEYPCAHTLGWPSIKRTHTYENLPYNSPCMLLKYHLDYILQINKGKTPIKGTREDKRKD